MTLPHTILLMPAEGGPLGLLHSGSLGPGASLPTTIWDTRAREAGWLPRSGRGSTTATTLVLLHDGEVALVGYDQVVRALRRSGRPVMWYPNPTVKGTLDLARRAADQGLATVLYLDANGQEMP